MLSRSLLPDADNGTATTVTTGLLPFGMTRTLIVFACSFVVSLGGCGESTNGDGNAPAGTSGEGAVATEDTSIKSARFAEAQQLVDFVQRVLSQTPPDSEAFYDLFYCTEPWQQESLMIERAIARGTNEIERACLAQFGRLPPITKKAHWPIESLEIVALDERSARIECRREGSPMRLLHLVKVDGAWWIDGKSVHYTDGAPLSEQERRELLNEIDVVYNGMKELADGIRRGTISWDMLSQETD